MLKITDFTKIKYVALELIRKGVMKPTAVECGLLMGSTKKLDNDKVEHQFILLVSSHSSLRMYNTDMYDILTLDVADEDARYVTIFTKDEEDQKAARTLLDEITATLIAEGRNYKNDPSNELIDVETYTDYPETVLLSDNLTGSPVKDTTKNSSSDTNKTNTGASHTANGYTTTTYTKQEPTVAHIKRKGKLPAKEKLVAIREKVLLLAKGELELKTLPIPNCDKKEDDDKKTMGAMTT